MESEKITTQKTREPGEDDQSKKKTPIQRRSCRASCLCVISGQCDSLKTHSNIDIVRFVPSIFTTTRSAGVSRLPVREQRVYADEPLFSCVYLERSLAYALHVFTLEGIEQQSYAAHEWHYGHTDQKEKN